MDENGGRVLLDLLNDPHALESFLGLPQTASASTSRAAAPRLVTPRVIPANGKDSTGHFRLLLKLIQKNYASFALLFYVSTRTASFSQALFSSFLDSKSVITLFSPELSTES